MSNETENSADGGAASGQVDGAAQAAAGDPAAELLEYKDKYLRALAEAENIRKRATKERSDLLKYQGEQIFRDVLEVVDDLERALEHRDASLEQIRQGLEMIYKKTIATLGRWEVRSESAVGKDFDPMRHEALSRVPSADAKHGSVLNEFRKGYMYKDRLLRPAQVVVAERQGATENK